MLAILAGLTLLAGLIGVAPARAANSYDLQITLTHTPDPVVTGLSVGQAVYTVWLQMESDSVTSTGSDPITVNVDIPANTIFGSDTGSSAGFTCAISQPSTLGSGFDTCTGTPDLIRCQTLSFTFTVEYPLLALGEKNPDAGVSVAPAADNQASTGFDSVDPTYVDPVFIPTPPRPAPQPNAVPAVPPAGCPGGPTPSPSTNPNPSPSASPSPSPSPSNRSYDLEITLTHKPDPVVVGTTGAKATYTFWLQLLGDSATSTGSDSITVGFTMPRNTLFTTNTGGSAGFTCANFQPTLLASGQEQCTGTPNLARCQTLSFTSTVFYAASDVGEQNPDASVSVAPARDDTAEIGLDSVDPTYVETVSLGRAPLPLPQPNPKPAVPPLGC
jgi:hypothetical protein